MKVVIVSKALIAGAAQKKLEELARLPDIDLVAVVPPGWREPKVGWQPLERRFTADCMARRYVTAYEQLARGVKSTPRAASLSGWQSQTESPADTQGERVA